MHNTNVYSLNGTATTSSGGSSSGYDTLSITTALGQQTIGNDNSNNSSGSGGSLSNTGVRQQFNTLMNKSEDNHYNDLGRDELNSLMNIAVVSEFFSFSPIKI